MSKLGDKYISKNQSEIKVAITLDKEKVVTTYTYTKKSYYRVLDTARRLRDRQYLFSGKRNTGIRHLSIVRGTNNLPNLDLYIGINGIEYRTRNTIYSIKDYRAKLKAAIKVLIKTLELDVKITDSDIPYDKGIEVLKKQYEYDDTYSIYLVKHHGEMFHVIARNKAEVYNNYDPQGPVIEIGDISDSRYKKIKAYRLEEL